MIEYLVLRRDAMIYAMNQTETGREYLSNAWRLEQVSPDKDSLRRTFAEQDN